MFLLRPRPRFLFGASSPFGGHPTLANNLASYWKQNEESGTRFDSHGSNNLTDNNTVGFAAGKIGNAASFIAANNESLTRPAHFLYQTAKAYTFWYKSTGGAAVTHRVFHDGATYLDIWYDNANNLNITLQARDAGGYKTATTGFVTHSSGQWIWVYAEVDPNNRIALSWNNGALITTAFGTETTDDQAFKINADNLNDNLVDEFGGWSRVQTAGERSDLWDSGNGLTY